MRECDTVFFLDYPPQLCLLGVSERKGMPRSDMPWVESEDDEEFLEFIKNYNTDSRPRVKELLSKYSYKDIYIFKNRAEADIFLGELSGNL